MSSRHLPAILLTLACSSHAQDLNGTSWRLAQFQGADGKVQAPDDKTKYAIEFGSEGRVSARIDCNRGTGTWKSSGPDQLRFGPLALTRAMCPPGYFNEHLGADLDLVRSYAIKNRHLFLYLMDNAGVYEFERTGQDLAESPSVRAKGPIQYGCTRTGAGNTSLTATFYATTPALVLVEWRNRTRPAFQVLAASGAKYEGKDLLFWDEHGEAMVTWSGIHLKCKPR
jgi:heat shock protein HslJ/membrane-bound inhibitor of C-type lysozyme